MFNCLLLNDNYVINLMCVHCNRILRLVYLFNLDEFFNDLTIGEVKESSIVHVVNFI